MNKIRIDATGGKSLPVPEKRMDANKKILANL